MRKKFDYDKYGKFINEVDKDLEPIFEILYYFSSRLEPLDDDDDVFFDEKLIDDEPNEMDDFMEKVKRVEKIFGEYYNIIGY